MISEGTNKKVIKVWGQKPFHVVPFGSYVTFPYFRVSHANGQFDIVFYLKFGIVRGVASNCPIQYRHSVYYTIVDVILI